MTETVPADSRPNPAHRRSFHRSPAFAARLKKRYAAERRFKYAGMAAVALAAAMLVLLLGSIAGQGWTAFRQTKIALEVTLDPAVLDPAHTRDLQVIARADFAALVRDAALRAVPQADPSARRALGEMLSSGAAYEVADYVRANPGRIGSTVTLWLTASADVDQAFKGLTATDVSENERRINNIQLNALHYFEQKGTIAAPFNTAFFTNGDSSKPEQAGILGAVAGSALTLLVTMLVSVPIGVAAAVYLEEFAPKNRWTDLIEVNINNLAAVPSIVFGLLGLAMFLNVFGLPRSAPLVGGLVLALMTLPVIIISSRVAMKAVPLSIREGALSVGASPLQAVMHHVLPLALPGILTGTIIGLARALGETAPLLMVGMVAFIADVPQRLSESASVLPVQIYMWSTSDERAFVERTSAAILVLLVFLIVMNGLAVFLRKKYERRW